MPTKYKIDYAGKLFGRLTVIKFVPTKGRHSTWECKCECGNIKQIKIQALTNGTTVSCGCYHKEVLHSQAIHGENRNSVLRTGTYSSWANMMIRSEWGNHPSYEHYGAKGIKVNERWHNFENFRADMGTRPEGTSIDRIDNRKGYEPGNCRWATPLEQSLNTSRTVKVIYNGRIIPVYTLCEELKLSKKAIRARASRRNNDYVAALLSIGVVVYPEN